MAVFDAPYELLDEALSHRLGCYGTVMNIRRCGLQGYDGIQNGTRVVKMKLNESIPSFLRFGRKLLRVKHEGQTPTCRKCNRPGHLARSCPNEVCFNCDELGHQFRDCPEVTKCSICREDGHFAVDCRLSWWCRPPAAADDDDDDVGNGPPPARASSQPPSQSSGASSTPPTTELIPPPVSSASSAPLSADIPPTSAMSAESTPQPDVTSQPACASPPLSSQLAVTHPSTNPARQGLTSVIGREPVFFFNFFISKVLNMSCV